MTTILPSAVGGILLALACAACRHGEPVVAPAAPLPASPDVELGTMDAECGKMVTAYETYIACPNMEDDERAAYRATIERWQLDFAAGKKGNPDEAAQRVIARACQRAGVSLGAATERCHNGKRPRDD